MNHKNQGNKEPRNQGAKEPRNQGTKEPRNQGTNGGTKAKVFGGIVCDYVKFSLHARVLFQHA
jgi:hypothetical protein